MGSRSKTATCSVAPDCHVCLTSAFSAPARQRRGPRPSSLQTIEGLHVPNLLDKLTADNGGAPCVQDSLLSLAICKPMICMKAQPSDLLFGFAANSLYPDNRLIYIAHISERVCNGMYYKEPKFANCQDCIYRWRNGRFERHKYAKYHAAERNLTHDLGTFPDYRRAKVLLSNDFRYFGGGGSSEYKSRYPLIRDAVEHLGQGQRVNHSKKLHDELWELKQQVWRETHHKIMGKQSSDPRGGVSHRSRSCGVVDCP